VTVGDNQASVLAAVADPEKEISLTLGTGAQISVVVPKSVAAAYRDEVEFRPYLGDSCLAVGAPLCGGAGWANLMSFVESTVASCGFAIDRNEIFKEMNRASKAELDSTDLPVFTPSFLGERSNKDARGEITGLTLENFTFGKIAASLALGIITNFQSMIPAQLLEGKERLVVSGNGFRRNESLRLAAEKVFGMPLSSSQLDEEAACGATFLFKK
jgi:sedoheptulokinase